MRGNRKGYLSSLRLVIYCLAGLSASCGPSLRTLSVAPEFKDYIERFHEDAAQFGIDAVKDNLIVRFGTLKAGTKAKCFFEYGSVPTVVVNKKIWDITEEEDREIILYHELGHCLLDRDHDDDQMLLTRTDEAGNLFDFQIPASIMNTYGISGYHYNAYRQFYLSELFGKPMPTASIVPGSFIDIHCDEEEQCL